jgi:hypothetical protein
MCVCESPVVASDHFETQLTKEKSVRIGIDVKTSWWHNATQARAALLKAGWTLHQHPSRPSVVLSDGPNTVQELFDSCERAINTLLQNIATRMA